MLMAQNQEEAAELLTRHTSGNAVVDLKLKNNARARTAPRSGADGSGGDEPRHLRQDARMGTHPRGAAEIDFNISEAARRLGMHRRTLARKLEKQRVK